MSSLRDQTTAVVRRTMMLRTGPAEIADAVLVSLGYGEYRCPRCGKGQAPAADKICPPCDTGLAEDLAAEYRERAEQAEVERDRYREAIERVRDVIHGKDWAHALVKAADIRTALDQPAATPTEET